MIATPVPGQRVVCDAEPELGLGLIAEVGFRTLTIDFPATGVSRQYARANAPLRRIRHEAGDTVHDDKGKALLITEVNEQDGLLFYHVVQTPDGSESGILPETRLSAHPDQSQPLKRLSAGLCESSAWFTLRRKTIDALAHIGSSPLLGLASARTELLPHQLYIAHEVSKRPAPRVLLCDEVGLGKTIEACLILQQQLFNGLAGRVLILVPDSLVHQWLVELRRRFNLHFSIMDKERCEALTEVQPQNPFESAQLVLASQDFLAREPRWQREALAAGWDLLIVDEAHHLLGLPATGNILLPMVQDFAAVVPGLILLTATPGQGGLGSHFALLQLLDPHRFHDYPQFLQEQQRYQELAALLDPLLNYAQLDAGQATAVLDGLREFASDAQLNALIEELAAQAPGANTLALQESIVQALLDRHGTGRIVFRNSRKQVSGFPRRSLEPRWLEASERYRNAVPTLYPEHAHWDDGSWLKDDPRVAAAEQLLAEMREHKFLLICHERRSAEALETWLRVHRGIRSAVFHEGMSLLERDRAAAWFAEQESGAQLLVCSEIGSEGRNFQFASHLILFDLPDDPDLLEQRIGRLDRIGQGQIVHIHVPCAINSPQALLLRLYDEALGIFSQPNAVAGVVCRALAPLLHEALAEPANAVLQERLLAQAKALNEEEKVRAAQGRDRLLELNSCRGDAAASLLERVTAQADMQGRGVDLGNFLHELFAAYGLEYEVSETGISQVKPSDDMLVEHFPEVPDEGLRFTLQRRLALHREDLPFVNWLHPLVLQSLDLVLQDDRGKATVVILRDKRLAPGTLLMEAVYRPGLKVPPRYQPWRWLEFGSFRVVVDDRKRELSASLPQAWLDQRCSDPDRDELRALVRAKRSDIERLHRLCLQVAQRRLAELMASASVRMTAALDAEVQRLEALRTINPMVSDAEIDFLREHATILAAAYADARAQPEALRLMLVL